MRGEEGELEIIGPRSNCRAEYEEMEDITCCSYFFHSVRLVLRFVIIFLQSHVNGQLYNESNNINTINFKSN